MTEPKPESEPNELTVVEQREVVFYDDELTAVRADDGHIYVSVRQLCQALGLARRGQVTRIQRHTILADGYKGGIVTIPPSEGGRGGGPQTAGLLRVDLVPLWLSGVRASRVKEDLRPKLERFQREAAKVLWEAFQEGRLTAEPPLTELLESDSPAVQAYRMARAMMELARNQILMEARLDTHDERLVDHDMRLEELEATLGTPGRAVTPEQAMQISQAVKAIAMTLSKATGTNQYGSVYGEMYRKFGITSYKLLPAERFQEAMGWLTEWHQSLNPDVPF